MKISATNQLKGKITNIQEGAVNGSITIDIGGGNTIVSIITMDSIKRLDLKVGSEACAIVKASNVMIGVE